MARKASTETLFHALNCISLVSHNALCCYSSAGSESAARRILIQGLERLVPFMREAGFVVADPISMGAKTPETQQTP